MSGQEFKNLFSPLKIGNVTVPNRIILTGASSGFYSAFKALNERQLYYYLARAKGGVGLIIATPHLVFGMNTYHGSDGYRSDYESDEIIPVLRKVAEAIHQYPTKIFAQLSHPGSFRWARASGGGATWAPSPLPRRSFFTIEGHSIPHQMEKEDIQKAIKTYGEVALRMKQAGYDGVEIYGVIGLLQAQFLSQVMNTRTDEYGGSLENRMRFLLECIGAIREKVGPDYPIGVRFTADELLDWAWWTRQSGRTLEGGKELAKRLEDSGQVNYLFPSVGTSGPTHIPPMYFPLGAFTHISAGIKEVVDLPVFAYGRINDPVLAEKILSDHQADMVGMTRALICDPELPNKAREGRLEEIRHCIACNDGCYGPKGRSAELTCALNYEVGREQQGPIVKAEKRKRVMVIGGGAAGLEAARVAALRGHEVSLYEKNDTLAKELEITAKAPGRQDFLEVKRYLVHQLELLKVEVHLGIEMDVERVLKEKPEVVIVATGATLFIPEIPGANSHKVVETHEVLLEEVEIGRRVLVVDYQYHMHALDVADFLAERGRQVEIITDSITAGNGVDPLTLQSAYFSVLSKGVKITPLTGLKAIQGNSAVTLNILTGIEGRIEDIDTVVVCTDGHANDSLYRSLKGKVPELYLIGQALAPRRLLDSIADAYTTARNT